MKTVFRLLCLVCLFVQPSLGKDEPVALDSRTKIAQYAGSDLIKHPIGMTFTLDGKLLAVESHTHLRPKKYNGPESDQIIWIQDTDNDGIADKRSVFYTGKLSATMNIAVHPESGAVYVATRNGVHRLWDRDGDGKAEEREQVIFFDFESEFLDNGYGCAGLAFDKKGDLLFGIGGLLGAPYTLKSSDGIVYKDQGEGGNIWHCTRDGEKLRRFATGFWNPFGLCHTEGGFVFATDNDPSSRPPSRLHHVIDGGDYGYQYRYGRSGQHPFIAWDGELPGTLPMLHGTGDAPCDVIHHDGNLIVSSWSDHRVEVYPLHWDKTHFKTEQKIMIKGGLEFRPVGFAVGPDGTLYISDWVKQDYQLHGHGKIWRVTDWQPEPTYRSEWSARTDSSDPWNFSKTISGHREEKPMSLEQKKILDLLSARFHKKPGSDKLIREALADHQPSETLRLLALKWIADQQLKEYLPIIEKHVANPVSAKIFHAAITTKARMEGQNVMDDDLEKMLLSELDSPSALVRRTAFLLLEKREKVDIEILRRIYEAGDKAMRGGVALTLGKHTNRDAALAFAEEIMERDGSDKVRAFASLAKDSQSFEVRPRDELELGEYLFFKNCAQCHRVNGYGRRGGPDLSRIGVRGRKHIIQSVRNPSDELAPMYETWKVRMADGKEHTGFVLGEKNGIHFYSDATGKLFQINTSNMVERERLPVSLMPASLDVKMGESDFEYLVNWLETLR